MSNVPPNGIPEKPIHREKLVDSRTGKTIEARKVLNLEGAQEELLRNAVEPGQAEARAKVETNGPETAQ
jgi:hypothetical protein